MRDLRYGIEIEMTGLSRGKAAETLAGFFGTRAEHTGGGYDAYAVRDALLQQTVHTAWSW